MKAIQEAEVGSLGFDSLQFSNRGTLEQAQRIKAKGAQFFVGYLGAVTLKRVQDILATDMGFMPVTFGGEYEDGAADEVAQLKALSMPPGVSVWLDMEGLRAFNTEPTKLSGMINAWAEAIAKNGWMPCLYVGAPQPLTSLELHALKVVRYWKGMGRCVDRFNKLAEPLNGWCMIQAWPSVNWNGVLVDANMVTADYKGRVPMILR